MSYVIQLKSCRVDLDGGASGRKDSAKAIELGLSDAERRAVASILQRYGSRPTGGRGDGVRVTLRNGAPAEVQIPNLKSNKPCTRGTVSAADLSPHLLDFLFDLARAGNWMFTPQDVPYPFVISEKLRIEMCIPFPRVRSVYAPAVLWNLLRPEPPAEEGTPADGGNSPDPTGVE